MPTPTTPALNQAVKLSLLVSTPPVTKKLRLGNKGLMAVTKPGP